MSENTAAGLAAALNLYTGFCPWSDVIADHPAVDQSQLHTAVIRGTEHETHTVPCRDGSTVQRRSYAARWEVVA